MRNVLSRWRLLWVAGTLLLLTFGLLPASALAHERRAVGNYSFLVGFNVEPAIQGQPNGAQLTVTVPGDDNRAVDGLDQTLTVSVAFGGGQPKEFKLRPVFGHPGQYVADFIPTRSGTYIFHFTGTVQGTPVDEQFESGPGRFDDVQPIEALQFPDVVPPNNDAIRAARSASDDAAAALAAADNARTVAMVGIGIGLVGVIVGAAGVALAWIKRSPQMVARQTSERS